MPDYPQAIVPVGHVEPVPRRVRALLGGRTVLDTTAARYVWEWPALRFDWGALDALSDEDEQ